MEHLKAYRQKLGISQADFAVMLGTTQAKISKLENKVLSPNLMLAHKIEVVTEGAVPMSAWVEQPEQEAS